MHVISRKRLRDFEARHSEAKGPLDTWFAIMKHKRYTDANQLKEDFPNASLLGKGKTVFNIGGNKYRLVVTMRYNLGRVYVRQVLTHADYDRKTRDGTL